MSSVSRSERKPLSLWQNLSRKGFGYAILFPALLVILGLNLYPTISGILTSFYKSVPDRPGPFAVRRAGQLFQAPERSSLPDFARAFAGVDVFRGGAPSHFRFNVAQLLIQKVPGIHFFRSVAMITWVLPIIASVVMFRFMTLPSYGFVNILLKEVGLGQWARNWFGDETFAFLLVLIMHLWRNVPFYAIAFMAAMQAISSDIYEAARITERASGDSSGSSRSPI